ncbi:MAG TPA: ATP-binding cassette domain-containing protein, partial [Desulfobacteraceae bacterium]|nr:ATP-binding cassette domain-containing protein [Desulfobacteraceae bacterium]
MTRTSTNNMADNSRLIIETRDLCKYFTVKSRGKKATLKAVDEVNLKIYHGKTLGLVGESGSGKSTIAFTMVQFHKPTSGDILYEGQPVAYLKGKYLKQFREQVQMVFQDPYSSLDPRQTLKTIVERPLKLHTNLKKKERLERIVEILNQVGLDAGQLYRYPHEFSGGQRQRIAVARALAVGPRMIVCDEPVSALDVSVQAQILNLLKKLQEDLHLAYLFVAHDLNVVRHISDDVAVIYMGRIVENAPAEELFTNPVHPYTRALLASMPGREKKDTRVKLIGEISSPINPPPGCRLATRCPMAKDECLEKTPELKEISPKH